MSILRDVLAIIGAALIICGCWLISASLAFIIAGAMAIATSCWWATTSVDNDRDT